VSRATGCRRHLRAAAAANPPPSPRRRAAAGHRSPHLVEECRRCSGFSPPPCRQGAPVSYRLHPHARRVTSPLWVLERRLLLRLRRCSATADRAVTRARRAVTAPTCACAPHRAVVGRTSRGRPGKPQAMRAVHRAKPALWPWATHAVHMGQASTVSVGHVRQCN
jgi:hypothetical protein